MMHLPVFPTTTLFRTSLLLALSFLSFPAVGQLTQIGTIQHLETSTDKGYRLYHSHDLEAAHLINPQGRYLHSWSYPQGLNWDHAEMLPNGHLIAIIEDRMILELDWHSKLVWKAILRAHHDLARKSNGRTLVLSRSDLKDPWGSGRQLVIDRIVEYDRKGELKSTWKYEEHQEELAEQLQLSMENRSNFKTWPHLNTLEILPANPSANQDKRFHSGNWLISGRHGNFVAIVHRSNGKILWAWGPGKLQGPHKASMLPNGNILVYDAGQQANSSSRGYSRILELNPLTEQIVWEYTSPQKTDFFSPNRGSAERLPNGNTLIADSDQGQLFEVTQEGKMVWGYFNPDRRTDSSRQSLYLSNYLAPAIADPLLKRNNLAPDFTQTEWKEINRRSLDQAQYKRLNRESIAQIEVGYLDDVQRFQEQLLEKYPEDEEGLFVMSLLQTRRGNLEKAMEYVKLAAEKGFPLERYAIDLNGLLKPLTDSEAFQSYAKTQSLSPLTHGPMLGQLTAHSASVWLRSNGPQQISIHVKHGDGRMIEHSVLFSPKTEDDYSYRFLVKGLEPNQTYAYEVWIDNQQVGPSHRFRTPAAQGGSGQFKLGFGGGAGFTPWYERMWDTLATHELDLFLALGDNVYIDHPERPITQKYCYFRRQSREEYRRFIGSTAQYAIWDDHDFTYNDQRGGPEKDTPYWKRDVLEIFQQNWNNPSYGGGTENPGIWFDFSMGDVDFFLLDCRYYRENPKDNPTASMLGAVQKQWLKDQLKASTATFKIIASSVPWAEGTKPGSLDTWDGHPEEREEIFSFLESEKIEGVLLISADRHRSDAWRMDRPNGYPLYDFMSSRLTNVHVHKVMPASLFGYNKTPSFGMLEFDTTKEDPQLIYRILSIENEEIHRMTIYRSMLSFRK